MRKWEYFFVGVVILMVFYFRKEIVSVEAVLARKGGDLLEYMRSIYDDIFKKWGEARGLDWKLLRAFAKVESDLTPSAIGDQGNSIGLMQLQHWHWEANGLSREDMFDPDKNIQVGSGFIADLMGKYAGDVDSVIQAYNLGETKFNKGYTSPDYLAKVKREYEALQAVEV